VPQYLHLGTSKQKCYRYYVTFRQKNRDFAYLYAKMKKYIKRKKLIELIKYFIYKILFSGETDVVYVTGFNS